MKKEERKNYFLVGALVLLLFLSYKIISSYLIAIITAFILAYLIRPLYNLINKKFSKSISAFLSILILMVLIIIPAYFGIKNIANEATNLITNENIEFIFEKISSFNFLTSFDFSSVFDRLIVYLTGVFGSAISYFPSLILNLVITLLGTFYILINWEKLTNHLKNFLPVENKEKKMKEISKKSDAIIYGLLFVGIIEGLIALAGFYFSGINNYIIASILIFLSALIPGVGPALIWIPLAVYSFAFGTLFNFFGVVITGCIISYGIDTFFSIKFLGNKSKINPFIMLIGILGGISIFGVFGFIIGPLVLVYTLELLEGFFK